LAFFHVKYNFIAEAKFGMKPAENVSWDLAHKLKMFSLVIRRKTAKLCLMYSKQKPFQEHTVKQREIFLISKEIQKGSGAKSYMTNSLLT
jgi:hypothetical protein